ncbi:hypothetical protein [Cysteiniphilum sp. 6C5]|uniref:hypothetical protein n=1 Tax=unclassified Cysteiniphilum TaxID=2610889 RepID=UPI003F85DBB1
MHENFSVKIYDKLEWNELPASAIVIDVDDSTQYLGRVQASVIVDELTLFAVGDLDQCTTLYYSDLAAPYYRHVAKTLAKSGYSIVQCKASSNIPLMLSMPKSVFLTSQKAYCGLANISHKLKCYVLNPSIEHIKFSISAQKYDQDVAMIESLLGKLNLNKNNTTEASSIEHEWSVAC